MENGTYLFLFSSSEGKYSSEQSEGSDMSDPLLEIMRNF